MKKTTGIQITPELTERICQSIIQGGFPHIAAQAAGVRLETFERWMKPSKRDGQTVSKRFQTAIKTAEATARLHAEIAVMDRNPLEWLKAGPGKQRTGLDGWTTHVKPSITRTNQTVNLLLNPQMAGIFGALMQVLAPFPDARLAVAKALGKLEKEAPMQLEQPNQRSMTTIEQTA